MPLSFGYQPRSEKGKDGNVFAPIDPKYDCLTQRIGSGTTADSPGVMKVFVVEIPTGGLRFNNVAQKPPKGFGYE